MSPITGLNAPLLPDYKQNDYKQKEKPASIPGAVFNVSTSIIGAGIMSIPFTLKMLGVIPAFVLILIVAWLADVSVEFLMRFTRAGETTTYAGVMGEAFGRLGSVVLQLCIMVTNFGCLVVFLIIIGDVLCGNENGGSVHLGVLQEWFGVHWWNSRAFAVLVVVVPVLLPLVLFKRLESLRYSSAVSVFLAVVFVGISSVMAISAIIQGKTEDPKLLPHIDKQNSFFDLFTAVPVIVTAFTFHFNVHPIGFELERPSNMIPAVKISLIICAAIYFTIGIFGYLLFGESTMSDILINFDRSSTTATGAVLNDVVRISYALHLMLVYPLLNYPLRANIDEFLFPNKPPLVKDNTRYVILTLILLALKYLAAIAFPNIWYFFQFVGSTSTVCIAFVFPGAIVLRDAHKVSTRRDKIMATIMIVLAVVTSTINITTNIVNVTRSDA